ncbi:xanthine dehydrogenase family protein molybdopterin-binding subunit, partial [Candidatus Poribacteria bacterium]|nr:xanthine dehydrogenase family protein molybdopterin-binding subunit [Candidatus Poribacteria bacterium]
MARRDFFKVLGGGIVVLFAVADALAQQGETGGSRRRFGRDMPSDLGAWLHIGEDGAVTVYTGKVEVGQNIRTSLTQVVAEELSAPLTSIHLVMGDTDKTPFDQGTFGSRTTPTMAPQLRKAAAAARELLIDLAAEGWKVDRDSIVIADGKVTHPPTGQSVDFGQLTKGQKLMKPIGEGVPTAPAERWKVAGTSIPKVNGRDIVTGTHRYTSDMVRPGMWYGKVLRPPAFSATLVNIDTRGAEAMEDVTVVRDGDFVGVAAKNEHLAARAIEAIQAEWKGAPQPSHRELFDVLKKRPGESRGGHTQGTVAEGLQAADVTLEASYTVAYIAHAPLEPRAAVAEWDAGKLTVWTGTQRPFGVRGQLAEAFGMPEERIRVIMPDTGSGYGGKHTGEAAIEAARLAKA